LTGRIDCIRLREGRKQGKQGSMKIRVIHKGVPGMTGMIPDTGVFYQNIIATLVKFHTWKIRK
jgi:hypothetical protein